MSTIYNKFIVMIAVLALGVAAGWYVMGGRGNIPAFPSNVSNIVAKSTPMPTSEASGLFQYREQTVTGMPTPTGSQVTKGGLTVIATATPTGKSAVKPTPTVAVRTTKENVSYTDSGFTPTVLTVKIGTPVVFTNNSAKNMWVAYTGNSADIDGFDGGKSVARGGTFEYPFLKIGTWKYQNRVAPDQTGIVIVTK